VAAQTRYTAGLGLILGGDEGTVVFVGHALLAFALAVLVAEWRGWPSERAVAVGVATGAFAALPDVDILYAVVAVDPTQFIATTGVRPEEFWGPANEAHRLMTHSLTVAAVAGAAFGLWTWGADPETPLFEWPTGNRRRQAGAVATAVVLAGLVVVAGRTSGPIGAFVMTAFAVGGVAIATVARSRLELSPRIVGLAAVAGIASHPWGDMVTGSPPALLYPFEAGLVPERVLLSSDPTLHLLGAFAIELAAIALAAVVVARHRGYSPAALVDGRAVLGVLYGGAALVMVPPTIEVSYHFVASIVLVGVACASIPRSRQEPYLIRDLSSRLAGDAEAALRTTFTALGAIALALASYAVVYLLLG